MAKFYNSVELTIILLVAIVASIFLYLNPLKSNIDSLSISTETYDQERSDTLHIYSYPNYFPEEVLRDFQQDENIVIQVDYFFNNDELLNSLLAGNVYDLIVPTDYMIEHLRELRLIDPIRKELIPNYSNLDIRFREMEYDFDNQYSIPYFWGAVGLTYDQNHIMSLPLTWSSLLDTTQVAHLRNRIAILEDPRMSLGIVLIAMGLDPNTTDEVEISNAVDILIHLSPFIGLVQSEELDEPLLNGDVHIAMNWSGSSAKIADENKDFRFVLPAEGSIFFVDSFAIPVNAKAKSLSYKFIDFLLDAQNAARMTNANFFPNPITSSRKYIDRIILKGPAYINPFLSSNIHVLEDLGDIDSIYQREWSRFREHMEQVQKDTTLTQQERGKIVLY